MLCLSAAGLVLVLLLEETGLAYRGEEHMTEYRVRMSDEVIDVEVVSDADIIQQVYAWDGVTPLRIRERWTSRLVWSAPGHMIRYRARWNMGSSHDFSAPSDEAALAQTRTWDQPPPDSIEEAATGRIVAWNDDKTSPTLQDALAALRPFIKHYDRWMDGHPDEDNCSVFAQVTFGDLRRARDLVKAIEGVGK